MGEGVGQQGRGGMGVGLHGGGAACGGVGCADNVCLIQCNPVSDCNPNHTLILTLKPNPNYSANAVKTEGYL